MTDKYISIYVKYKNDRKFVSKVSVSANLDNIKIDIKGGAKSSISQELHDSDQTIFKKYLKSSYKIIEYGSIAGSSSGFASVYPHIYLINEIDESESLTLVRKRSSSDLFIVKEDDSFDIITKINNFVDGRSHAPIIQNAIFSGLVSSFDNVLAKTIDFIIKYKPEILKESDIKVSLFDISSSEEYKYIRSQVMSDYIMTILMKSREDQISWIENALSIKIKSVVKNWSHFIEICERRNVYIHHDSIVTERYYEKARQKPKSKINKSDVGKRLVHSSKYFDESADVLFEVSTMIIQSVCRSVFKDDINKLSSLDDHANDAVYSQNMRERYKSAANIADYFSKNIAFTKDNYAKMVTINYATAKYMMDDLVHAKRIVDAVDWSSAMPHFQLCVHAVRGESEQACALIGQAAKFELVSLSDFKIWPVFRKLRNENIFWDALKEAFGENVSSPELLLEHSPEEVAEG